MSNPRKSAVSLAEYVDQQINIAGLRKTEVASALGYSHSNIISMFTKGHTKIPLGKIAPLADVLGVDRQALLRRALSEYSPELLAVLQEIEGDMVTNNERRIINHIREVSDNTDPHLDEDRAKLLEKAFGSGS